MSMPTMPACFGHVIRCGECARCAVNAECYEEQAKQPVFLLLKDRPAKREGKTHGARYVPERGNSNAFG